MLKSQYIILYFIDDKIFCYIDDKMKQNNISLTSQQYIILYFIDDKILFYIILMIK